MIRVRCVTNLDISSSEEWPTFLPVRPMVDDLIAARSGLRLRVVRVTIKPNLYEVDNSLEPVPDDIRKYRLDQYVSTYGREVSPCGVELEVELHAQKGMTVREFERWYAEFRSRPERA